MRVALVHDWLTGMRGGEKVLDAICELFPEAPLYTLVHVPGSVSERIESRRIVTSFAQRLPAPGRFYRHYLPLYPIAVQLMDLRDYDLVISSSHCAVKSVVAAEHAVHVSYCHSPMRYAWDQFDAYFGPQQVGKARSWALRHVMRWMARWDAATAGRVDRFVANSQYVAGRIRRYYNRGSTIVYPPVDTDFYSPDRPSAAPSCLIVSALVPYKRLDVAIEGCRRAGVPLKIVGTGPERSRLEASAHAGVEFLGWRSDDEIRQLYRHAGVTVMPGVEDFGIVPVEAQACGCPVVALDAGGARESVIHGVTGVLVGTSSPEAFATGIATALSAGFDREAIRKNALRFSRQTFLRQFETVVEEALRQGPTRPQDAATMPPELQPADRAASVPPESQPADRAASVPPPWQPAEGAARLPPSSQPAERAARVPPPWQPAEDAASVPPSSQPAERAARVPPPWQPAEGAARLPPPWQPADRENKK